MPVNYIGNLELSSIPQGDNAALLVTQTSGNEQQPILPNTVNPPTQDAFGRLRVSSPATIFDSKQVSDSLPLFWDDQQVSGAGTGSTHASATASTTLTVTASTAGRRVRQTFRRFNYQPGKSQLYLATGVLPVPQTGITADMGLGDENNGLFFRSSPAGYSFVIRSSVTGSPVETVIPQSAWNVDPLDGTGPSGLSLQPGTEILLSIDFEWLGVGPVRFGFYANGRQVTAHVFNSFTGLTTPYISTPNLPCHYAIENDGTGAAASLIATCTSVISEAGQEKTGVVRAISRGGSPVTFNVSDVWYPAISLRLKTSYIGTTVDLVDVTVVADTNFVFEVGLFHNPIIAGTDAASWIDLPNSAIQYDISRDLTNTLSGGVLAAVVPVSTSNQNKPLVNFRELTSLLLGAAIDGTRDELVLAVRRLDGVGTEEVYASVQWRELL